MPDALPKTPEEIFWEMILNEPDNPTPRLHFADWCDENDKPAMAEVQRWLAATGRRAALVDDLFWVDDESEESWQIQEQLRRRIEDTGGVDNRNSVFAWYCERSAPEVRSLPWGLFRWLSGVLAQEIDTTPILAFATRKESEEAIAAVWTKATQRPFILLWGRWKPDYADVHHQNVLTANRKEPSKQEKEFAVARALRRRRRFSIAVVFLIIASLLAYGLSSDVKRNQQIERIERQQLPLLRQ